MNSVAEKTLPRTKKTLSVEELYQKLFATKERAEIVNGRIIIMPPTGYEPGIARHTIASELRKYAGKKGFGFAIPDNVGIKVNLPNRKSFSPDSSFHIGQKPKMKFVEGAPIFAVEVRSENDYGKSAEAEILQKRLDYFAAGTEIVWDVDLLNENVVKSYHRDNPSEPRIFKRGEIADAEPVLPNWELKVDELFD